MLFSIADYCTLVNRQEQASNQTAISYNRASRPPQEANGNLANQAKFMAGVCQRYGLSLVKAISVVESGRTLQRQGLRTAVALASETTSVVIAFSLLRLVRQRYAGETEVRAVDVRWLQDHPVTFLTYVPPDASLSEIRSHEIRLGIESRNQVDDSLIDEILSQRKLNISFGDIAKRYHIPKTTVQRMVANRSKH